MAYRKAKLRFYQTVSVALQLVLVGGVIFMAWAVGLVPRTSGLAFADDVAAANNNVSQKINDVEVVLTQIMSEQLEARLMENRRQQCDAIRNSDLARKKTYAEIMQDLKSKYKRSQGASWDEPLCEAL